MAWLTTKDGRHFNTDWIDKEKQIESNQKESQANTQIDKDLDRKKRQLDVIQKFNPKDKKINAQATWVESIKDIKTWEEAMVDEDSGYAGEDITPDFTWKDVLKAQKEGYVVVYSSKPIKQGGFVTPSKMIAISYGNKTPYSQKVKINDVAWIDLSEGQLAIID